MISEAPRPALQASEIKWCILIINPPWLSGNLISLKLKRNEFKTSKAVEAIVFSTFLSSSSDETSIISTSNFVYVSTYCLTWFLSMKNLSLKLSLLETKILMASANSEKLTFSGIITEPVIFSIGVPLKNSSVYQIDFCGFVKSYMFFCIITTFTTFFSKY